MRYSPDDGNVCGVVQIVHGMAEYMERYEAFAAFLTDRGFAVTGEDHLGHGGSIRKGGVPGFFCEESPADVLVQDVHRLKELTKALYPSVPYVILGHSMGSFILRNYICCCGRGIEGAIIMGTGMQPKALIKFSKLLAEVQKKLFGSEHVAGVINICAFGTYNNRIKPKRTALDWLTRDKEIVDRYIADPLCGFTFTVNGFQTLFELIYRLHDRNRIEKIPKQLPIFLVSGKADPVGDYGAGVCRVYASLKDAGISRLRLKLYEQDRHEILNELDRDVVMQDIFDWIQETVFAGQDSERIGE